MRINVAQLVSRNWPIKLAALFFAIMLYVAVAAQQPVTQALTLRLEIEPPPGRPVRQQPSDVTVLISGKGSELLKLRSLPAVLTKTIPDTFSESVWRLRLQTTDVPLPASADVRVTDISPHDVDIVLDSAAKKEVHVASRVSVEADSGFVVQGLSVLPSTAELIGPPKSVAAIDSVATVVAHIASVSGPFFHTVPIDTTPLGVVRVVPREVRVSGEVAAVMQRSFTGVVITMAASGFAGYTLATERVVVEVSGPQPRVQALTRDSLRVVAHLVGPAQEDGYARLTVNVPTGLTATAVPDSVPVKPPPTPAAPPPAKSTAKRKPGHG